jgi:folate-binding Fe-S cluster repair protein YgfZ
LPVDGPDATTFLNGQLSSDISSLTSDVCQYASYNSPGGRMLANMVLWRAGSDGA